MCMLIVWYCLISAVYFLLNIVEYLFIEVLKFNRSFFNLFYNLLPQSLINSSVVKTKYDNTESLSFKALYLEYLFFYKNGRVDNLRNSLILFNFNKSILSGLYDNSLSFLIHLTHRLSLNSKKIDFSKPYSNLTIINNNHNYVSNNSYVSYKLLTNLVRSKLVSVTDSIEFTMNKVWNIKYAPSNFMKYITLENFSQYNILYLRKNKVFNKGRYSRNRQYYRTGVYWCLYVNIIAVIGIYFWFYRFTMNFGYLWWLLFVSISSFIVPKTIKYRLYNPLNLINSIFNDIIWVSTICISFYKGLYTFINKYFLLSYLNNTLNTLFNKVFNLVTVQNNKTYLWEYSNTNYYVLGSVNSQPYAFQKIKIQIAAFINSVFNI
jgi:hypothetical protein